MGWLDSEDPGTRGVVLASHGTFSSAPFPSSTEAPPPADTYLPRKSANQNEFGLQDARTWFTFLPRHRSAPWGNDLRRGVLSGTTRTAPSSVCVHSPPLLTHGGLGLPWGHGAQPSERGFAHANLYGLLVNTNV